MKIKIICFTLTICLLLAGCNRRDTPQEFSSLPESIAEFLPESPLSEVPEESALPESSVLLSFDSDGILQDIDIAALSLPFPEGEEVYPLSSNVWFFWNYEETAPLTKLAVGDLYGNFKVEKLDAEVYRYSTGYVALSTISAAFSGSVTLTGELRSDDYLGLSFTPDPASAIKLPYALGDGRTVWFTFENEDSEIKAMAEGIDPTNCQITIDRYGVELAPMSIANYAHLSAIEAV